MVAPVKLNFKIYQGSTFNEVLRWESSTKVYKNITSIYQSAPMVVTATAHGAPAGWRVKLSNVAGMKEVNSTDYIVATEVSEDTLTFNDINAVGYTAYTSGGILEYNQPNSLAGYTAVMQIREKLTSTAVLLELTTENDMLVLDNVNKTITITIDAVTTAAFTFKTAVYSIELTNGAVVTPFVYGNLSLVTEITR